MEVGRLQVRLRKSHSGCVDCKTRKVKCDEVKPVCSNCRRRYIGLDTCKWRDELTPFRTKRRKTVTPRAFGSSSDTNSDHLSLSTFSIMPSPVGISHDRQGRLLELRLMHHYTSIVSPSMPDCETDLALQMWEQRIPQLAFESDIVLNPMLALSALHLHAHMGHDPPMASTLRRYLDRALQHHRHALVCGARELSEPTWLSAVILSNVNWLLSRYQDGKDYELPLQMWRILHGVGVLFSERRDLLDRMGYGWYGEKMNPIIKPMAQLSGSAQSQMRAIDEDLQVLFREFRVNELPRDEADVYHETRTYISDQYRGFYSGTAAPILRWWIGSMVSRINTNFRENLEQHDPLSMALLARLLVLLRGVESVWWMDGVGEYAVLERDIPGIASLMPPKWQWTMQWPLAVFKGEVQLRREVT